MKAYRLSPNEIYHLKKIQKFGGHYTFERWPEIYWGNAPIIKTFDEKTSEVNEFDTDYLGAYHYYSNKEGRIELYKDRIAACASELATELDIEYEIAFTDLCFIVLLHEVGHWFTHWCHKPQFQERREKYIDQPIEIKETLAQLTVMWSIARLSNINVKRRKLLFSHLAKKQSKPYQHVLRFDIYYTKRGTILRRYNDLLDEKEWGIEYLFDGIKHETEREKEWILAQEKQNDNW